MSSFTDVEMKDLSAAPAAAPAAPRKKRKRVEPPQPAALASGSMPTPPRTFDDEAVHRPITVQPRIELMRDMPREFPNCAQGTSCTIALAASASAAGAGPSLAVSLPLPQLTHFEASQMVPLQWQLLEASRDRVRELTPQFRIDGTTNPPPQPDIWKALRMEFLELPVYGAAHESNLLRQSGTFTFQGRWVRHFPPCKFGRRCVGFEGEGHVPGLTQPITLMRAMSPTQWDELWRTDKQPAGNAPCVLCHRSILAAHVHNRRLVASGAFVEADLGVAQIWRNKVDEPDGYNGDNVIRARPGECIVAPLCTPNYWGLKAVHKDGVMWVIDQSAMVWRPPTLPGTASIQPGTQLRNF